MQTHHKSKQFTLLTLVGTIFTASMASVILILVFNPVITADTHGLPGIEEQKTAELLDTSVAKVDANNTPDEIGVKKNGETAGKVIKSLPLEGNEQDGEITLYERMLKKILDPRKYVSRSKAKIKLRDLDDFLVKADPRNIAAKMSLQPSEVLRAWFKLHRRFRPDPFFSRLFGGLRLILLILLLLFFPLLLALFLKPIFSSALIRLFLVVLICEVTLSFLVPKLNYYWLSRTRGSARAETPTHVRVRALVGNMKPALNELAWAVGSSTPVDVIDSTNLYLPMGIYPFAGSSMRTVAVPAAGLSDYPDELVLVAYLSLLAGINREMDTKYAEWLRWLPPTIEAMAVVFSITPLSVWGLFTAQLITGAAGTYLFWELMPKQKLEPKELAEHLCIISKLMGEPLRVTEFRFVKAMVLLRNRTVYRRPLPKMAGIIKALELLEQGYCEKNPSVASKETSFKNARLM